MTNQTIGFVCHECGQYHEGIPDFGWDYPIEYLTIPKIERSTRVKLDSNTCIIDDKWFFVQGCIEIHVHGSDEPFIWGVWVSLSEQSFNTFCEVFNAENREESGPFFGWLTAIPPVYPDALLKTMVHLRSIPTRPYIEVEPTEHPLAIEQREGMPLSRVQEIFEKIVHNSNTKLTADR